jgi:DNA polymerase-3 subunit delta'
MSTAIADDDIGASALAWPSLPPWHRESGAALLAARARFPPALLVHGPRGIGKHALALHLAQGLLCETPLPSGLACDACVGCHLARAGQHPDLLRLELIGIDPERGEVEATDTIAIDRIRAMIDFAQLTSHRQRAKVVVIAPADRMTVAAANALLKTLEEPPPATYLMLVSDHRSRLAPTIVSRCRRLGLPLPAAHEARAWLVAQGVAEADLALAAAGGAPLVALRHADPAWQAERGTWIAAFGDPRRMSPPLLAARIEAAGKDQRKARLADALDWLVDWTADLARVAARGTPRRNPGATRTLAALAPRVAPARLFRYHRSLLRERTLIAHPLSPRLVAEAALIEYRELFV